ncbi:MAG: tRNA (guanosine(46)-N7)-methyltransferase TrmB [Oscillospiraceae bacterium]|nr:tRNA (guanosine(46)-N7)-methyltransferase TrmB [Oscillospiraceae bacterium]
MRMRKKPNLLPRMEKAGAVLVEEPEAYRGQWRTLLPECRALHVELGCGKGRFTADTAEQNPDTLLLAVEKVPDAMVVAMERATARELNNVRFLDRDVTLLPELLAPGEAERIYINFCDPWPKSRCAKNRLTAPGFLRLYADALAARGEIHFKTDNLPLFEWSVGQFRAEGWEIRELTNDLHGGGVRGVMTDYEAKFHAEGVKINRLVAVKTGETKSTADGSPPRLRNASLSDAKGREESLRAFAMKERETSS